MTRMRDAKGRFMKNPQQVARELQRHLDGVVHAAQAALYQGGSVIMTEAKLRTPVDKGDLQGSGYVTLPQQHGGATVVEVGFGGEAKAYAVDQHESLHYKHEVGEAKYLENAINATEGAVKRHVRSMAERGLKTGRKVAHPTLQHETVPK